MFFVRQQNKTIQVFTRFVDAWLYVYLECDCYAVIVERNENGIVDTWVVNPAWNKNSVPIV